MRKPIAMFALALVLTPNQRPSAAQCQRWSDDFGNPGIGSGDGAYALTSFDDGTGPALYVTGSFSSVGGTAAPGIAKWNGSQWSIVGAPGEVSTIGQCLTVHNDGTGNALYLGGATLVNGQSCWFARWNGTSWSNLGGAPPTIVSALYSSHSGTPGLYAAGIIITVNGVQLGPIAKWNGSMWSSVVAPIGMQRVFAFTDFDDGSGPTLCALGESHDELSRGAIQRWTGNGWNGLATRLFGTIRSAVVWNNELVVGGQGLWDGNSFSGGGTASWNGSEWSAFGSWEESPYSVLSVCGFSDNQGPALYAGGAFSGDPGNAIARWTGARWEPLGAGLTNDSSPDAAAWCLTTHNDGSGPALFVGGRFFTHAGESDSVGIAKWSGSWRSSTGDGNLDGVVDGQDIQGFVNALVVGGEASASYCAYDLNADGVVSGADVSVYVSILLNQ